MKAKYENESFLSTGSNAYGEREEAASLLPHEEEEYATSSDRVDEYKLGNYERKCEKCVDKYNQKKKNRKWNYFIIFFLGTCLGFAIWPFFMTILTYKLFYTSNINRPNFKADPKYTPTTHRTIPPPSKSTHSSSISQNKKQSSNVVNNSKDEKPDANVTKQEKDKKPVSPKFKPIRFDEIAGIDESKVELLEIVDFLKNREKYYEMGARMPKGVLLVGPPGSGKTMLARAVATEANVPYIYTSGPEFIEIYVGQGAKRIRQLFAHARSVAPSIVFIDEIDAVGGKRSSGSSSGGTGQREHDQTLNQLLVEMDGFSNNTNIMVIGATNRIDTLDNALLRPGRFDRIVYVPLPDVMGRKKILQIYVKKIKSDLTEEDILRIARLTPGFSGADLENVVNEATILATRNRKEFVTLSEMNEARDKVSMGPERKSLRQSELQRKMTAYHEAGHAIVAYFLHPKTDPIHKATIVSRGNALGYVEQIPMDERQNYFKSQMEAKLAVCMGGRTAEEIVFGKTETSSGASSDISSATEIAYKMVTEWGMSDKLGPLDYKKRLGDGLSVNRLSTKTIATIENEVRILVERGKTLSEEILRKYRKELDSLAIALLDRETLSGEEIKHIIDPNNKINYNFNGDKRNGAEKKTDKSNFINDKNDLENMSNSTTNNSINETKMNSDSADERKMNSDSTDEGKMNGDSIDETKNTNIITNDNKKKENHYHFSEQDIDALKTIAKHDLQKIKRKNAKRTKSKLDAFEMLNLGKKGSMRNKNEKERDNINKYKPMKSFHEDGLLKNIHGNLLKNINKLHDFNLEKKKDKHKMNTNNNSNNIEDFLEGKVDNLYTSPFLNSYHIENVEEMKRFSIFEHNLNKLFLFDIF